MVATTGDPGGHDACAVLTPYASFSLRASVFLFIGVSIPIIVVAVISGMLGNWYAMPASLTMVAVLGIALRSGYRRTQIREVVSLSDDAVAVERGHRRPEERYEFARGATEVVLLEPSGKAIGESHLLIRAGNRQVEVGAFLDSDERHRLAAWLARVLGQHSLAPVLPAGDLR